MKNGTANFLAALLLLAGAQAGVKHVARPHEAEGVEARRFFHGLRAREQQQRGEKIGGHRFHRVLLCSSIRTKLKRSARLSCLPCASRVVSSHSSMRAGSGSVSIS